MAAKNFVRDTLTRLIAFHENATATIKATLALMEQGPIGRKPGHESNGLSTIAKAALEQERKRQEAKEARRAYDRQWRADHKAGKAPYKKAAKKKSHHVGAKVKKQREHTAAVLAQFDLKDPLIPGDLKIKSNALGPLVRRGYLTQKGGGYIRTAKPFHVDPRDAKTA